MKKSGITVFTDIAFLFLLITFLSTTVIGSTVVRGKIAQAATVQKCGQWRIIPNAKPASGNILIDVAVIAANDVWAVGLSTSHQGYSQTLAEHWNGKAWEVVTTPNSQYGGYLHSVVAFATNNVWAVGYAPSKAGWHTLIEHWNGTTWKIVTSPNVGSGDNLLWKAAAVAPNDIWAVGYYSAKNSSHYQALIEHWNGTIWQVVPGPNVKNQVGILNSVTAIAKNDIWSVGSFSSSSHTLIEHWNGSNWQIVASPNPGASNSLEGVEAVSANDIWAVGNTVNTTNSGSAVVNTLTEHWDGTTWKVIGSPTPMRRQNRHAIPNFGEVPNTLEGLAVVSATNIWVVGNYLNSSGIYQTLIEHWNGKQWSVVASPNVGSSDSYLWNAARVGNTPQVWAVGYGSANYHSSSSLTEYYC